MVYACYHATSRTYPPLNGIVLYTYICIFKKEKPRETTFAFFLIFSSDLLRSGVVFPYYPPLGRYNLNFNNAVQACEDQEAVIASHEQLLAAWKGGLDWCNAGWLSDGTVQYPITKPRHPCGGSNNEPGLRTYGRQEKIRQFDVFCYTTALKGQLIKMSLYMKRSDHKD